VWPRIRLSLQAITELQQISPRAFALPLRQPQRSPRLD
jgi:hypothetical protein